MPLPICFSWDSLGHGSMDFDYPSASVWKTKNGHQPMGGSMVFPWRFPTKSLDLRPAPPARSWWRDPCPSWYPSWVPQARAKSRYLPGLNHSFFFYHSELYSIIIIVIIIVIIIIINYSYIISYHIISNHIISNHIISYYIILYYILYYIIYISLLNVKYIW